MTEGALYLFAQPLKNAVLMIKVQTWQISITAELQTNTTLF